MVVRPLDDNGDILPVSSMKDLAYDSDATCIALMTRVRLYRGDWWEDSDVGFNVADMLIEGVRTEADIADFEREIESYLADTPGVSQIYNVNVSKKGEIISVDFDIDTVYDDEPKEVIIDGIL